ncbi:MAG: GreA/GreB family elongation factor, partial [Burkholderiales bacterium]|nr:GreA/GreB family elongation factor [Burkholderiales bacterium]
PSRARPPLVAPEDAEPAKGRISVVSPLGRTLMGLRRGTRAPLSLPGGRAAEVEVLSVERPALEAVAQ